MATAQPISTSAGRLQRTDTRQWTLAGIFALAALALAVVGTPATPDTPRWPSDERVYSVQGWSMSGASVDDSRSGIRYVTRTYQRSDGLHANLGLTTSQTAKAVYRAGSAVPFLGGGYSVEPVSPGLVPTAANREAIVARRGTEAWLQVSTYGERRGLLGNGALAWGWTVIDAVLHQANDYYLLRLVMQC